MFTVITKYSNNTVQSKRISLVVVEGELSESQREEWLNAHQKNGDRVYFRTFEKFTSEFAEPIMIEMIPANDNED